jgi:hypothetical protein
MGGVSISLVHLVQSLLISAVLIWLNRRGTGPAGAVVGTIAACVALAVLELILYGRAAVSPQALRFWLLFVLLPGSVLLGASRLAWLPSQSWWFLLVGPLVFMLSMIFVMVTYNVAFAARPGG